MADRTISIAAAKHAMVTAFFLIEFLLFEKR
jgi:hypothetical protein